MTRARPVGFAAPRRAPSTGLRPVPLPRDAGEESGGAFPPPAKRDQQGAGRRRKRRSRFLRASIALLLLFASHAPALADFRVCNKTRSLINLAIGTNAGDEFATEGWWVVTPGSCSTLVRGALTGRYVYLYATDIEGDDVLKGAVSMCIDRGKFRAYGVENCWRRGLQAVTFAEIDTLDSPDWTTFLKEPGR